LLFGSSHDNFVTAQLLGITRVQMVYRLRSRALSRTQAGPVMNLAIWQTILPKR
jgi:hypothetical protein